MDTEYDHLNLDDLDRQLIRSATGSSKRVFLAPMDKGLSGSSVWQSRWQLQSERLSQLHVFKIGPLSKLTKEEDAILNIASVIDRNFPLARLYKIDGTDRGLLRLEFAGDPDGLTFSLRNFITKPQYKATPDLLCDIITRLYRNRFYNWHYCSDSEGRQQFMNIRDAVPWWESKIDLMEIARDIGYNTLNSNISKMFGITISEMDKRVREILETRLNMQVGPVHGDLHAQNVNLDSSHNVYVIDYGNTFNSWRALDFIILESAIKFAASPPHCPIEYLMQIDHAADTGDMDRLQVDGVLFPERLKLLSSAVSLIRGLCAEARAEPSLINYRYGLVCAAAAFTSIEWMINRVYLFYNIALQLNLIDRAAKVE